jgi:hypothetical protein
MVGLIKIDYRILVKEKPAEAGLLFWLQGITTSGLAL